MANAVAVKCPDNGLPFCGPIIRLGEQWPHYGAEIYIGKVSQRFEPHTPYRAVIVGAEPLLVYLLKQCTYQTLRSAEK